MEPMTFSDLVAAMEERFPGRPYSVAVELEQEANSSARCEHDPKVRRSLNWKIEAPGPTKYETVRAEGRTPAEALAKLMPTPVGDLAVVDAHKVESVAKDDIPF